MQEDPAKWKEFLSTTRFAITSANQALSSYTPTFLNFAREMRTPMDVHEDIQTVVENDNFVPEITPYLKNIRNVLQNARETRERRQDHAKKYADQKRSCAIEFKPGNHDNFVKPVHLLRGRERPKLRASPADNVEDVSGPSQLPKLTTVAATSDDEPHHPKRM